MSHCLRIRKKKHKQSLEIFTRMIYIVSKTLPKCAKDMNKDEYISTFRKSFNEVAADFGYIVDIYESNLFDVPAFRLTFTRNPEYKPKYSKHINRLPHVTICCSLPIKYNES